MSPKGLRITPQKNINFYHLSIKENLKKQKRFTKTGLLVEQKITLSTQIWQRS